MTVPHTPVYTVEATCVVAQSQQLLSLRASRLPSGPTLLAGLDSFEATTNLHTWTQVVVTCRGEGRLEGGVLNTTHQDIFVPAGMRYGHACTIRMHADRPRVGCIGEGESGKETNQRAKCQNEWSLVEQRGWLVQQFHLTPLFAEAKMTEAASYREMVLQLLTHYWDVFSHDDPLGRARTPPPYDGTATSPSLSPRPRYGRLAPAAEEEALSQLHAALENEPITTGESSWGFTLVAIYRPHAPQVQWCIDRRQDGPISIQDISPTPRSILDLGQITKSTLFSSVDGCGTHHLYESRSLLLLNPWGWEKFKKEDGVTYQRLTQRVLDGLPLYLAAAYMRESCLHSPTLSGHLKLVQRILDVYRVTGVPLVALGMSILQKHCWIFRPSCHCHWITDQ